MSTADSDRREHLEKASPANELSNDEDHPNQQGHGTALEHQTGNRDKVIVYLKGWRLHTLTFA